jgi:4,5-DOPA dioxygenase extradiol
MSASTKMPVVFFGHGSPMNVVSDNPYTAIWRAIGQSLPRPRAILSVSAHWYTRGTGVTAVERPQTIHDFYGFPQELYEIRYAAPGDPALARRVKALLAPVEVALDGEWGLDHGTWSVLKHAYPAADIPVVQLSIDGTQPPRWHYETAKRLMPLRDEGVLVMGSGDIVHNLHKLARTPDAKPEDWALRFDAAIRERIARGAHDEVIDYAKLGEDARLSVPTPDHYLPLLYCLALQQSGEPLRFEAAGAIDIGSVSMTSFVIG